MFFGCGLRRHFFLYVTQKMTLTRYLLFCFIQMLEFPLGVACAAKQFLYFKQQVTVSRCF